MWPHVWHVWHERMPAGTGTGGWRPRCWLRRRRQLPESSLLPYTFLALQRGLLAGVSLLLAVAGTSRAAVDAGGAAHPAAVGGVDPDAPTALSYGGWAASACIAMPAALLVWGICHVCVIG